MCIVKIDIGRFIQKRVRAKCELQSLNRFREKMTFRCRPAYLLTFLFSSDKGSKVTG